MRLTIFTLLACLINCLPAYAAMNSGGYQKIDKIMAWSEYTNGTFLIQLETQHSLCPNGYWMSATSDSSSQNILSLALSAYHAQTPVLVYAYETSDWPLLGPVECEINLIILE